MTSSHPTTHATEHSDAHDEHVNHDRAHAHGGNRLEIVFAILAAVCTAVGWGLDHLDAGVGSTVAWACFLGGYVFGGFFTLREAVAHVRARSFEIDLLMLVAAIGAALLGEWFEGALLLSLFSLGHALEHYAMGRARRAIESLAELAPDYAMVRRAPLCGGARQEDQPDHLAEPLVEPGYGRVPDPCHAVRALDRACGGAARRLHAGGGVQCAQIAQVSVIACAGG